MSKCFKVITVICLACWASYAIALMLPEHFLAQMVDMKVMLQLNGRALDFILIVFLSLGRFGGIPRYRHFF